MPLTGLWTPRLILATQKEINLWGFFFWTIKVFFILNIFQISISFAKEVVRPLNASLCCAPSEQLGDTITSTEYAYTIPFLFLIPARSNQSQLLQCRQNQRQQQHWKCAWGEQDRGPLLWLRWGNETQPQTGGCWRPLATCQAHKAFGMPGCREVGRKLSMVSLQPEKGRKAADKTEFSSGKEISSLAVAF